MRLQKTPLTPFLPVFTEMKFALNALPETFINMLQSLVSLRRIEKYLGAAEVKKLEGLGMGGGEWFRWIARFMH